ncbi:ketopantoate reductase family protein [Psychromarinibacter halotolerans]|uniref:2-dehydropantoate 2-reductase n=1 Tax=Psychromarinibacter halotolerans TaxID=1775175 RepID=A0ABV7GML5_9RHOB|nr:2-dehydropantoate 2-reductase [Psychromarinibacter halotolerans]MDF0596592.1 2-dehydropantoate 2-reductase [Psychromarinibacter halotolerans]
MKVTVFGAGATGGHFAVRLSQAGHDVSVVARGAHLEAIRSNGLTLLAADDRATVKVRASADATEIGVQDVVLVGVKGAGLAAITQALRPLVGPDTRVIFPQNGMPWWYPVGLTTTPAPPDWADFSIGAGFLDYIAPGQLVGGSIYSANELDAPGVVRNASPGHNRLDLGAVVPGGDGVEDLRRAFRDAGIDAPDVPDIRAVIWRKLLANMSGSIIALITGNKSSISRKDPALGAVYRRAVGEGMAIAAAYGYDLADTVDVDAMLKSIPEHKPSIRQDFEAGRPMEIGQILLAPLAFARQAGVDTPVLDTLAALAQRMAEDRGLFQRDAPA